MAAPTEGAGARREQVRRAFLACMRPPQWNIKVPPPHRCVRTIRHNATGTPTRTHERDRTRHLTVLASWLAGLTWAAAPTRRSRRRRSPTVTPTRSTCDENVFACACNGSHPRFTTTSRRRPEPSLSLPFSAFRSRHLRSAHIPECPRGCTSRPWSRHTLRVLRTSRGSCLTAPQRQTHQEREAEPHRAAESPPRCE